MKTMAYYFFKWHSRAQVLQAQLFQPLPRTQEQRGRQEREAHRALLTPQFVSTFLPQDPGLGCSGTQRQGLFLLIPVNDSHTAESRSATGTAPAAARREEGRPARHSRIRSEPPDGGSPAAPRQRRPRAPPGDSPANAAGGPPKGLSAKARN